MMQMCLQCGQDLPEDPFRSSGHTHHRPRFERITHIDQLAALGPNSRIKVRGRTTTGQFFGTVLLRQLVGTDVKVEVECG